MVVGRLTWAVLVGCLATSAVAGERSSRFAVSVRVTSPLRKPTPAPPPASFVLRPGVESLACPATGCAAAVASSGRTLVVTTFVDGTPPAVVER